MSRTLINTIFPTANSLESTFVEKLIDVWSPSPSRFWSEIIIVWSYFQIKSKVGHSLSLPLQPTATPRIPSSAIAAIFRWNAGTQHPASGRSTQPKTKINTSQVPQLTEVGWGTWLHQHQLQNQWWRLREQEKNVIFRALPEFFDPLPPCNCPIYLDINIILCDTFWSFLTKKYQNYNHNYHSHHCHNHCYWVL